ncbi:MAG: PQQ-binding-like beta-propeller repeat protein [Niastella sp.]|nr:PQQ-binding-like beta-propeller repeat protein [Niastella sp.]
MKKIIIILNLLLWAGLAQAQTDGWTKTFPSKINWYKITDAGILIAGTKDGLYGITPADGKEAWKIDNIENIQEENYDPIEGTPYIVLAKRGLIKSVNNVVDVVTGKVTINTRDLGFQNITKRIHLIKSNALLFYGINSNGKPLLMMVNLATGQKIWEQQKLFEKNSEQIVSEAGEVSDAIFIATNKNIYKLNKATGEQVYNIDMKSDLPVAAPPKEKKGMGSFVPQFGKKLDEGANEQATMTSADFFQHTNPSIIYFWNQDIITAFNIADGKEVWERVDLPSPITNILFDERGMLIATAEKTQEDVAKQSKGGGGLIGKIKRNSAGKKNRASLLCLDVATGKMKWDSDVDLQGDVLAYKMVGNKLILATARDQGTNFISLVNLDEGKSLSKKPLSIKGEIRDLQIVPQGLYFRTTDQINILDLETAEKKWAKGFQVKHCIGANSTGKIGYVYANEIIYKVNFETGDLNEWVKGISFNGKEEPGSMQVRDNGLLLTSDQNARLYDFEGKQLWHNYQPAPGRTMGGKLLSGLGGLAATMMAAQQAAQAAQMSYAKGYYGSTNPQLDSDIKTANANAAAFAGAASSSFASISRRFKATKEANNFMSMLTNFGNSNMAKDAGVMIVDKNSGKEIRKIIFGDKKDPDYKIDELGKVVYYKTGGNEIQGFTF